MNSIRYEVKAGRQKAIFEWYLPPFVAVLRTVTGAWHTRHSIVKTGTWTGIKKPGITKNSLQFCHQPNQPRARWLRYSVGRWGNLNRSVMNWRRNRSNDKGYKEAHWFCVLTSHSVSLKVLVLLFKSHCLHLGFWETAATGIGVSSAIKLKNVS